MIRLYLKTADAAAANPTNDDGNTDIDVTHVDKLRNLLRIGQLVVDEASTSAPMVKEGYVFLPYRMAAPVVYNATQDGLSSTAADHGFDLISIPGEIQ